MSGCPKHEDCPLFPQFTMEQSLRIWRTLYCDDEGRYHRCERYRLGEEGRSVPPTMLPNGEDLRA